MGPTPGLLLLASADLVAAAAAGPAYRRCLAVRGTLSATPRTHLGVREADRVRIALLDGFQRDVNIDTDVFTASRSGACTVEETVEYAVATRTETEITEQAAKVEISKQIIISVVGHALESAGIVPCAFLGIREYRVGGGNAFETFLGFR